MKTKDTANIKRRAFLKGAAVSTVAVSSAAVAGRAVTEDVSPSPAKSKQGYKLTRHVKEYYRLARF